MEQGSAFYTLLKITIRSRTGLVFKNLGTEQKKGTKVSFSDYKA